MGNTLPDIRLPADTWINIYQANSISGTPQLVIQNIGQTRIRYHHGQNPPTSSDGFLTREPNKPPIETQASPNGLWAYSESAHGSINASSLVLLRTWTPNFTGPATITIPTTSAVPTGRAVQRNPAQEVPLSTATDITPPITNIGNGSFEGQIQQWRNSERDYQLIVRSETLPTDLVVRDELGTSSPVPLLLTDVSNGVSATIQGDLITVTTTQQIVGNAVAQFNEISPATSTRVVMTEYSSNQSTNVSVYTAGFSDVIASGSSSPDYDEIVETYERLGVRFINSPPGAVVTFRAALSRSTDGTLTNFPAAQRWVPVLGTGQGYLGNRNDTGWINGVAIASDTFTSFSEVNVFGSWRGSLPSVGSILSSGGIIVQITNHPGGTNNASYTPVDSTRDQIQAAFEYPNVFDIQRFDASTQGYVSNFTGVSTETYIRGIAEALPGTLGDYLFDLTRGSVSGSRVPADYSLGDILTANNGSRVSVVQIGGAVIRVDVITGTDPEIQEGFQWPNHFTVTPPP